MGRDSKEMRETADVAIVGAGPAGLMAAIASSERGAKVVVCEQLDRAGVKLLATGGGHGNLSNTLPESEFMARFGKKGRFMHPALKAMGREAFCAFLAGIDVPTHSPDGFKVFPVSNSARTVQEALVRCCRKNGVEIRTGVAATGLIREGGTVAGLETGAGPLRAAAVILAAGGKGYRELGGSGTGFEMAQRAGHRIVKPVPALVPLVAEDSWVRDVAGVSLQDARVRIDLPRLNCQGVRGEMLFTHHGVSGPAILDISGEVAELLEERKSVPLCLNLLSQVSHEEWGRRFDQWHEQEGRKRVANLLDWHLPASLARVLCKLAGVPGETTASSLTREERQALLARLISLELTITGTEGFDQAMVTRGGVSLKEVNPATLESRIVPRLFFAGEILDLDGPTGGFNLQWAFSSGYLAGLLAARFARSAVVPT
jgi:predicted Rossmann fold flavoprotein